MKDKVCLITGATAGIGAVTARVLAERGATVVLVGRNPDKSHTLVDRIRQQTNNPNVDYLLADLSSQQQSLNLLVYTSAPLPSPMVIAGAPQCHLYVRSSAPETHFVVRLSRVLPDGRAIFVTLGAAQIDVPEGAEIAINLDPTAVKFAAGERIATALTSGQAPNATDVRGFIGGSLEAYDRCVADGKSQLAVNYQTSLELQKTAASLRQRVRAETVQECRAGLTKLDALQAELARYQQELADSERAAAPAVSAALPTRTVDLNDSACMP